MSSGKVTLFIWLTIAALALLCIVFPEENISLGETSLRWPSLQEVMNGKKSIAQVDTLGEALLVMADSIPADSIPTEDVKRVIPQEEVQISDQTLPHLSRALVEAGNQRVRIVHYGDSQIEEDRITSTLRRKLQEQYGGGGVGLIPLHQTIPTLGLRQRLYMNGRVQTAQGGPKRYLVYGLKSWRLPEGRNYGPMGQVAEMNDSLVAGSEELMLTLEPLAGQYAPMHRHSQVKLLADTSIHMTQQNDTVYLRGRGRVYGLSLESQTGVVVDNVPMRGCLGTIFTHMDSTALTRFYQESNTRLIILQYGGNGIGVNKQESTIYGICYQLRDQIRYLRRCAPEADIIFVGPSDMIENHEGELRSNPLVAYMDGLLSKICHQENVPYFSLYKSMGGAGSMMHWQEIGLAGEDGIHFTRSGANKASNMLYQWMEGMIGIGD